MEKRGQVSIETIFSISIILILFLGTLLFTYTKRIEISDTRKFIESRNECQKIANAIAYLNILGPGSITNISTIYNVSILKFAYKKQAIVKELDDITYETESICNIILAPDKNYSVTGRILISNPNGTITLKNG